MVLHWWFVQAKPCMTSVPLSLSLSLSVLEVHGHQVQHLLHLSLTQPRLTVLHQQEHLHRGCGAGVDDAKHLAARQLEGLHTRGVGEMGGKGVDGVLAGPCIGPLCRLQVSCRGWGGGEAESGEGDEEEMDGRCTGAQQYFCVAALFGLTV